MSYTMEDFKRDYVKQHFARLTPQEREEALRSIPAAERLAGLPAAERLAGLPLEVRLAGLSVEQIRQYLDRLTATRSSARRKPRRKKS